MCEFSSICLFLNLKYFFAVFSPTNEMYSNLNSTKMIEQISLVHFVLYIATLKQKEKLYIYIYKSADIFASASILLAPVILHS